MVYVGVDGQIPTTRCVAFVLILGISFLCLPSPCSAGAIIGPDCPNDGNKSSGGDKSYQYNREILFRKMITKSSSTDFYEDSEGVGGDQVYGSYLCIGEHPNLQLCSKCVQNAAEEIKAKCPATQIKARMWYDECLFQLSNASFFQTLQKDYISWCDGDDEQYNDKQVQFEEVLTDTLNKTANKAASDPTPITMFGAMEVNLSFINGSPTLYTLAQCVPGISPSICLQCLIPIITGQLPTWCNQHQVNKTWAHKGWTISSSCILRYDINPFYGAIQSFSSPALPLDTPYHNKGALVYKRKRLFRTLLIVAITTSIVTLLPLGIWCYLQNNNKDLDVFDGIDMGEITNADSLQMDFNKVRSATQNFAPDMKLGEGGFGDVFKGKLESGQEIAVKRLTTSNSGQGAAEFKNEVVLVAKLQHLNLVKLLGFCLTAKEKILVYEYLPNSSLDKLIFDPIRRASLNWEKRYNIITGIAKGLLYLLEDSRLRIIHRDLKSSNILLDEAMNPKISDFGIAKTLALDQTRASTEILAGTYGYMAPEYVLTGQYSLKSDIYSFGIIVLEIVTGQRNRFGRSLQEEALLHRAWRLWNENAELEMVDVELNDEYSAEEAVKCIHIGLLCIQEDAAKRPKMASVVAALGGKSIDLPPPNPPNFFNTSHSDSTTSASISVAPSTAASYGTQSTLIPR